MELTANTITSNANITTNTIATTANTTADICWATTSTSAMDITANNYYTTI